MLFDPQLQIGQIISNSELSAIYKCGNMGGMRRSHTTNTLVIISDYTKGLYQDKWIGGTLHYTGMGKQGNQDIHWAQNATLAGCNQNDVDIHLFEVIDPGEYIYCGHVQLVGAPYTETQLDDNGVPRLVWMFPVRPVPENNVRKPEMFVFKDIEDYRERGKDVDALFLQQQLQRKQSAPKSQKSRKNNGLIGKTITHKTNGQGVVKGYDGTVITVKFNSGETKSFNYAVCLEKQLLKIHEVTP